jgi:tripartite-type tricarboxylate transporter receptor subunit TctC
MQKETGIKVNDVPFNGATGAMTALLGGQCNAITVGTCEAGPNILSGKLKCLAIFNDKRASQLPDVPTTKELGYPNIKAIVWVGVLAPKGMPENIKNTLVTAVKDAVNSDEFKKFTKQYGTDWNYMTPEEFRKQADTDFEYYSQLFKSLGLGKK